MAGTKTSFTIGPARGARDLEAVASLFVEYAASLEIDLAYQSFGDELASLPGRYAPPQGALLLAGAPDGEPIGCVGLRPLASEGACEMKRLYVAPAGRGTGLGRALAEAIVAEARRIGYREMLLDTLPSMAAALGLYRSLGFRPAAPYYATPVPGTIFLHLCLGLQD